MEVNRKSEGTAPSLPYGFQKTKTDYNIPPKAQIKSDNRLRISIRQIKTFTVLGSQSQYSGSSWTINNARKHHMLTRLMPSADKKTDSLFNEHIHEYL